ncbi:hypothetical protein FGU65_08880 [Methanoculleus sp. FWC-SCC1]|uniref:Uncharacterized protein n=1 Tax=Methanoculleus frigidifontis TaxID=2584085 RepID=A0ABT8MAP0_9EURY|nr:hypothetical protein [Methanoculleus sp. FWC-SCC1]MDN7024998.1 hypothetical protein [Methanoculleus sp. FWC-SCC1]
MIEESDFSLYWTLFVRYSGIIGFLLLVGVMNLLAVVIPDPEYHYAVGFLNSTIWLLFTVSFLIFIGAVFRALPFPLNLPGPVFTATGSLFIIAYLFRIVLLADDLFGIALSPVVLSVSVTLAIVVFFAVLILGYVRILRPIVARQQDLEIPVCREKREPTRQEKEQITWDDVERELRYAVYEILHRIRDEITTDEKR